MRWSLLAAFAAACGTTITETRLNPTPPTARRHAAGDVELFASGPPSRAHVDVALLTAVRGADTAETAIAELRARAGAIGCDAIVVSPSGRIERGMAPDELSATCVVYTSP